MKATVENLRDESCTVSNPGDSPGPRRMLYCRLCGTENSADRGDYWNVPLDHEFICECGYPMEIVVKRVRYVGVR